MFKAEINYLDFQYKQILFYAQIVWMGFFLKNFYMPELNA